MSRNTSTFCECLASAVWSSYIIWNIRRRQPDLNLRTIIVELYYKAVQKLQKQARRTAMDRSNIGNLWYEAKPSRRLKIAISRSKNQNSHLQIIISIDIHQWVPYGKNLLVHHAYICSNLSFCHKTGSSFPNIEKTFEGSIDDYIKIPYTKFHVSMSFGSIYRLFQN